MINKNFSFHRKPAIIEGFNLASNNLESLVYTFRESNKFDEDDLVKIIMYFAKSLENNPGIATINAFHKMLKIIINEQNNLKKRNTTSMRKKSFTEVLNRIKHEIYEAGYFFSYAQFNEYLDSKINIKNSSNKQVRL